MILSRPLIGFVDGLGRPVCPINLPFKQCYRKRMNHFAVQYTPFVFPVQVSILDGINASINPEQFLAHIVNRQAIWPANFFVNKYG